MTEDEAKRQPCIGPEHCGQQGERTTVRYCIGSACAMAWRWVPIAAPVYSSAHGEEPQQGYCGLAGKP